MSSTESSSKVPERVPLELQQGESFPALVATMQRLLAPDGCPWDREQTPQTLKRFVLEEACEVIDAIDSGDPHALCDELGDLSLQVVFLAELARSNGQFGPDDVVSAIVEKLIRRHPHVFGDAVVANADDVVTNWNRIKVTEKGERKLLDGLPRALPALHRAQRIGERVAKVGFDWADDAGSYGKVQEELRELEHAVQAEPKERVEAELGDLFLALVNYARHLGVDAEEALRKSTNRFETRFRHVESCVEARHGGWPEKGAERLELSELDGYWEAAKRAER